MPNFASRRAPELRRLITRFKITGVYVTHDQTEALALCDRIAIMREGKIEQVGTAHFLLEHPVSAMVATFFGHPPMNVFDGVMVEDHFHADDFSVKLPEPRPADGRRISLGLRAAHIALDPNGPIAGEVVLVEPAPVTRSVLLYVEFEPQQGHRPGAARCRDTRWGSDPSES